MYNKLLPLLCYQLVLVCTFHKKSFYYLTSYQILMLAARRRFVLAKDIDFQNRSVF